MTRKRSALTPADRARKMRDQWPELSAAEIAAHIGISCQAVYAAIKRGGKRKRGRPRKVVLCKHCGKEA